MDKASDIDKLGRAGTVGDEVGSALIGAQLVRDIMRLAFLMERTYAAYAKWFGTAFSQLLCAPALTPPLGAAFAARSWQERERHLAPAYDCVAAMHNELGVAAPLPATVREFFGRPFKVIALHGFRDALLACVTDERVRKLAERPTIGGSDQFSDSTDLIDLLSGGRRFGSCFTDERYGGGNVEDDLRCNLCGVLGA